MPELKNLKLVDLSHCLSSDMPQWPSKVSFSHIEHMNYHSDGFLVTTVNSTMGCGTHVDAPCHAFEGGRSIDELNLKELYCPAVVINIVPQVEANPDYMLSVADIKAWEMSHGKLPEGALVVANTGWFKRWNDPIAFANVGGDEMMHFPGFSDEAAEYLLHCNVAGIGIDTFSLDAGINTDYSVHKIMLGHNKFQVECMANLDAMPAHGAYILTAPIKIKDAPEAFASVIGILPN